MNFSLAKVCRATTLMTVLLALACSRHLTPADTVVPHRQKRGFGLSGIINNIKDTSKNLFVSGSVTESASSTTPNGTTFVRSSSVGKLTSSQCKAILRDCGLADSDEVTKAYVKAEVDNVQEQYRAALRMFRKAFVFLIDVAIEKPSLMSVSLLCDADHPAGEGADDEETTTTHTEAMATAARTTAPATTTLTEAVATAARTTTAPATTTHAEAMLTAARTTTAPTTPAAPRCTVSQWSDWSGPLGFGTQERVRKILQPGWECPESENLKEYKPYINTTTGGTSNENSKINIANNEKNPSTPLNPMDNTDLVAANFGNDFIRASEGKPRDLLLILDSSGSITSDDFAAIKSGVNILMDSLCGGFGPNPEENRIAIMQFASSPRSLLSFSPRHQSAEVLKYTVDNLRPLYGYTCTGDALQRGYLNFQEKYGARNYSVHDTLVITDGRSNCGVDLLNASRTLQQRSSVYALAIGLSTDEEAAREITSIVSDRDPRHLFSLANFRDFEVMAKKAKAKKEASACQPIVVNDHTTQPFN